MDDRFASAAVIYDRGENGEIILSTQRCAQCSARAIVATEHARLGAMKLISLLQDGPCTILNDQQLVMVEKGVQARDEELPAS